MEELENLLAKQEIIRNAIKHLRETHKEQQGKVYDETMLLQDIEANKIL